MSNRSDQIVMRIEEVRKDFREGTRTLEILKGISLNLLRGELTLLMGPSGSGKTTLLTIMGLLLKPTTGRIVLMDQDVTLMSEAALPAIRRRHIGFIFQAFNLLSSLSAVENVEVALELQGMKGRPARKRALDLLAHVGLSKRWHHRPEALSGGEKQRVAVARALASPAELILADEPTGNLDSKTSAQVVETLQRLAHEDNRAVLVVTHDPGLQAMADRMIRLKDGAVVDNPVSVAGPASAVSPNAVGTHPLSSFGLRSSQEE